MLAAAGSLMACALAASGQLELGIRSEVRGLRGNELVTDPQSGSQVRQRLADPVPYEFDPYLSAAIEEPQRYVLRAGYSSRLLLLARPRTSDVVTSAHYGTGSLLAGWQPSSRSRLDFNGTYSQGTQQITPAAQLGATTTTSGGQQPPVLVVPDVSVAPYRAASARGSGNFGITPWVAVGGGLGFASGGAIGDEGRAFFPPQDTWVLDGHVAATPWPHDALSLRAKYSRTNVYSFGIGDIADAGLAWERTLSPTVTTNVGAGAAFTVHSSLRNGQPAGGSTTTERATPVFDAGIAKRPPQDRPGFGANLAIAYAPYVDPYTVSVQKRGTVRAGLSWQPLARWRLSGELAGAALIRDWKPTNGGGAAELAAYYLERRGEFGLSLRGGYTEVPRTDALAPAADGAGGRAAIPGLSYWEWSIAFVARWGWRTEL